MFTTDGSSRFASVLKALDTCTGFGITNGAASGATACSLAAFTPVDISVPTRTPIDSVNKIRLNESNFCLFILSTKLIRVGTPRQTRLPLLYLGNRAPNVH